MSERTAEREVTSDAESTTGDRSPTDRERAGTGTSDERSAGDRVSDRIDAGLSSLDPRSSTTDPGDVEAAVETESVESSESTESTSSSLLSDRLAGAFSIQQFLLTVALAIGFALALGAVLPFDRVANLLGVFLASATVGLAARRRHYLEVTAAGALTGGLAIFLGSVLASIVSLGAQPAFGVGAGALVALVGHYAGRDLRAGLERDL